MDDITRIERIVFHCPETDSRDYDRYPMIDKERFKAMEARRIGDGSKIHVYGYVRNKEDNSPFIDLYIWDSMQYPEGYVRFVIREGFRFSEEDLELFLRYVKDRRLYMDMDNMINMYVNLFDSFPHWSLKLCLERSIGEELERIYFISHRSGGREILYKAGLDRIADNIERIPGYNIIGSTPVNIIGHNMTLKLLRILNQKEFIHKLYSEESINECAAVYKMFASYIGQEFPSYIQWEYLTELYRHGGTLWRIKFNRSIYRQLEYAEDSRCFSLYEKFFSNKEILDEIYRVNIPALCELEAVVACMESVLNFKKKEKILNIKIKNRKQKQKWYEFFNDKYMIVMPLDCMDFCKEAMHQRNCLMNYIEGHAAGLTTILFVRKKSQPGKSYVTMEINGDGEISQVYGKYNNLPHRSVYEFIEEYSKKNSLIYDPEHLIMDASDELMEIEDEIWEYVEDYYQRNSSYIVKEDFDASDKMVQLTLKDCYPEAFSFGYY